MNLYQENILIRKQMDEYVQWSKNNQQVAFPQILSFSLLNLVKNRNFNHYCCMFGKGT